MYLAFYTREHSCVPQSGAQMCSQDVSERMLGTFRSTENVFSVEERSDIGGGGFVALLHEIGRKTCRKRDKQGGNRLGLFTRKKKDNAPENRPVPRGQWFNHAVSTLSSMGIVKGHNDGTFAPNAPITRAEFAAIAARFDDKNTDTSSKFTDIASHWAKNEIGIAANKGWINGYPDGTFRPNQYITRAEAMTLVNRVLNRLPENSSDLLDSMIKWPDNSDASAWYYLAVQEATNSHAYSDKSKDDKYEKWTTIRDARDWTELEK